MPIFDRQVSLGHRQSLGAGDRPQRHERHLRRYERPVGEVGAPAGLFKSTDGGASFIRLGSGYPAGNIGNANAVLQRLDQRHHRRSRQFANDLPRVDDGGVPIDRRRLNWTIGTGSNGDVRSLVLDTSSPAGARILYAGITNQRRFPVHRRRSELDVDPQSPARTPAVATAVGSRRLRQGADRPRAGHLTARRWRHSGSLRLIAGYRRSPRSGRALYQHRPGRHLDAQPPGYRRLGNTQGGYSFHMAVDPASPGDGANDIIYLGAVAPGALDGLRREFHHVSPVPRRPPRRHSVLGVRSAARRRPVDPSQYSAAPMAGSTGRPTAAPTGTLYGTGRSTRGGLQTTLFYNMAVQARRDRQRHARRRPGQRRADHLGSRRPRVEQPAGWRRLGRRVRRRHRPAARTRRAGSGQRPWHTRVRINRGRDRPPADRSSPPSTSPHGGGSD